MRALHWHPNASEWQYFISGKEEMTVFGSSNRARTEEFSAGDVGYVPQNYGHYIENTGESDLEVLQVWDNGIFEEIGDLPRQLDGQPHPRVPGDELQGAGLDFRRLSEKSKPDAEKE